MDRRGGLTLAKGTIIVFVIGGAVAGTLYVIQDRGLPSNSQNSFANIDGKFLLYQNSVSSQNVSLTWRFTFSHLSGNRVNITNTVMGTTGSGQYRRQVNTTNWFLVETTTRVILDGQVTYSGPWFLDPTTPDFIGSTIFLWAPTDIHVGSILSIGFGPSTGQKVQSVPIVAQESIVVGGSSLATWKAQASGWTFWYDQASGFLVRFEFGGDTLDLTGGSALSA